MLETIINFTIGLEENPDVYVRGYVECTEEETDWYFFNQNGIAQSRLYINHDDVVLTATQKQSDEMDALSTRYTQNFDLIEKLILNSKEGIYENTINGLKFFIQMEE